MSMLAVFLNLTLQLPSPTDFPMSGCVKPLAGREETVRAWPGGFGFAKVGASYGPSLIA